MKWREKDWEILEKYCKSTNSSIKEIKQKDSIKPIERALEVVEDYKEYIIIQKDNSNQYLSAADENLRNKDYLTATDNVINAILICPLNPELYNFLLQYIVLLSEENNKTKHICLLKIINIIDEVYLEGPMFSIVGNLEPIDIIDLNSKKSMSMIYEQCLELLEVYKDSIKENINIVLEYVDRLENYSIFCFETNHDIKKGTNYYHRVLELRRNLFNEYNKDSLAIKLADSYNSLYLYSQNLDLLNESIKLREQIVNNNPNNLDEIFKLAVSYDNQLSYVLDYGNNQDKQDCLKSNKALVLFEKLLQKNSGWFQTIKGFMSLILAKFGIIHKSYNYMYDYSIALNNVAMIESSIGNTDNAINLLKKVIDIRKNDNKEELILKLGTPYSNLGSLYFIRDDFKNAEKYFQNSVESYASWLRVCQDTFSGLDIAIALMHLGEVKEKLCKINESLELFDDAIYILESSIINVSQNHFYEYKRLIENAYIKAINYYSNLANPDKTLILIESLRKIDFLSKYENVENIIMNPQIIILSFQKVEKGVVLVISDSNSNQVYRLDDDFAENLKYLYNIIDDRPSINLIKNTSLALYNLLPDEIKNLFKDNQDKMIYISPDSYFVNLPFEFIFDGKDFIGKKHLLPRIYGIGMLKKFQDELNYVDFSKEKVIVSINPNQTSTKSDDVADFIKKNIENSYNINNIKWIKNEQATKFTVINSINNPNLAMFFYIGHGIYPDGISLENGLNDLYSEDLTDIIFNNNPIIFLNSCETGNTEYSGGGCYLGMSPIFLNNGASTVISSVYNLGVYDSVEFDKKFFENFLTGNITIGEAVMATRKELNDLYQWGLHILAGNPNIKIRSND